MKKFFAIALSLCMVLSVFSMAVFADENANADTFVGYSATRVEKKDLTTIPNMKDYFDYPSTQTEFKITDSEGLTTLAGAMAYGVDFASFTIYLANDINMKDVAYTSSGVFKGTFDGQGYMIENLVYEVSSTTVGYPTIGLFAGLQGGTIKNVVIGSNCIFKYSGSNNQKAQIGSLVGSMTGNSKIENCYSAATVTGNEAVGGLVGIAQTKPEPDSIRYCTFAGAAHCTHAWKNVAGIIGQISKADVSIQYCRNMGTITTVGGNADFGAAGGIIGRTLGSNILVENCINNGNISATNAASNTGSMVGLAQTAAASVTIKDCVNYGTLTSNNTGFCAKITEATVTDTNNSNVTTADSTLADATLDLSNPNFTPNVGTPTPPPSTGNEDEDDGDDTTKAPTTTKKPENTTAPANTEAPSTEAPAEEKKGCGSALAGSIALLMLTAGAALTVCKKKD